MPPRKKPLPNELPSEQKRQQKQNGYHQVAVFNSIFQQ